MLRARNFLSLIAAWLLLGLSGAMAQSGHQVPATVVGEITGQPEAEVFGLKSSGGDAVQIAFDLPAAMQGRKILDAVLHLSIHPLKDKDDNTEVPEGTLLVELVGGENPVFGQRTLGSDLSEGEPVGIKANGGALSGISDRPDNRVVLKLTGVEHGFYGPAATGEAGIDTRRRPRLVLTYMADGPAAEQETSDRSSMSAAPVWPDPAPDRLILRPLATQNLRSYTPVFANGVAVVLLGDEGAAKLTGISVADGRTIWASDPVARTGQHLFSLPGGAGFGLLGGPESYAFTAANKAPRKLEIDSTARGTLSLDTDRPPLTGPNGELYLADNLFLRAIDVNGRELWRVPVLRTSPMTLTADGLYLIATTDEGLRVIDTRSGDMIQSKFTGKSTSGEQPAPHCAPPTPDAASYDHFMASAGAPETGLLGPVSLVLRRDPDGQPTAQRIFASLVEGGSGQTGFFDLTSEGGTARLDFAGRIEGVLSAGLPDAKVPGAEACEGARSLIFVAQRTPSLTVVQADWWSGAIDVTQGVTDVALPAMAPAHPVRGGRDRVFLPVAGALIVSAQDDFAAAGLDKVELVTPPSGDLISPRLMLSETGGLLVMDTNAATRRLWAVEAAFRLESQDSICSPMAARLAGKGGDGLRITSGVAVRLEPGTTLGPDTRIGIGPCL